MQCMFCMSNTGMSYQQAMGKNWIDIITKLSIITSGDSNDDNGSVR